VGSLARNPNENIRPGIGSTADILTARGHATLSVRNHERIASVTGMRLSSLNMTGMNLGCIYGCTTRVIYRMALRYKTSERANSE
jgi:hypothetical protein